MILLGTAGGDIAGSRFEFNNHRSKDFELFAKGCFFTDDTVMTVAIAKAILEAKSRYSDLSKKAEEYMQSFGRMYPGRGYGGNFGMWIMEDDPKPYNSFGNGSAMRVSACGWAAESLDHARYMATAVAIPTHNHPEGVKGAVATAEAVWMARNGYHVNDIRKRMDNYYTIDFTLDEIRDAYEFNETCQRTVPQALEAFYESTSYEDAIRNAISIGGDSDTLAAITGAIAEAYYGIPEYMQMTILSHLKPGGAGALLIDTLIQFNEKILRSLRRRRETDDANWS